ncbi:hypothetical protein T12_3075 [Trichinella patagoniensis]|uniref:Uncharacterized protein n=1 Tax=Trichinella patagoniensis TaxID=990121 RepID=A0A0V0Z7N6_9BILA|nr:hypothetical protein T12_3075 [Trichinella patagoniensis]
MWVLEILTTEIQYNTTGVKVHRDKLKSLFMKCFNFCCCIGTKRTYHAEMKNLVFYVSIFYFSVFYGLFFMLSSAASFTWLLITVHIDDSSIYAYVLVKRVVRFVSYVFSESCQTTAVQCLRVYTASLISLRA